MSKRFWIENGEILDCGFFLSGEQQYVDIMNNLDQQITELEAELEQYKKNENTCCGTIAEMIKHCDKCELCECIGCEHSNSAIEEIKELKAENEKLKQQLKDNTKQVCEKIRKEFEERLTGYKWEDKLLVGKFCNITNDILDQIEKGE